MLPLRTIINMIFPNILWGFLWTKIKIVPKETINVGFALKNLKP